MMAVAGVITDISTGDIKEIRKFSASTDEYHLTNIEEPTLNHSKECHLRIIFSLSTIFIAVR